MVEFGAELRRRRTEAGLSLSALAAKTYSTKGYLSKIENDRARPSRSLVEACDRALAAGGELLALMPAEPSDRGSGALPAVTVHFVGRTDELERVTAGLRRSDGPAVQVITGLSGIGKTTLAVAAAHAVADAFPDGQYFVDLTPGTGTELTAAEAADRALRTLGVQVGRIPPDLVGRAALLRAQVRGSRVLLILDDVAGAAQVSPLLPVGAGSRVLVTSRRRLSALEDAAWLEVSPLSGPAAETLFHRVSGLDGEPLADDIVRRCGCVPLAVRIVAARLRHGGWTATEIVERLADQATRIASMDDGERSMAAVLGSSIDGLAAAERTLLGLLAIHPGPVADLPTVAALAELSPTAAETILTSLHEASLATREPGGWYSLHDLVRAHLVASEVPRLSATLRQAAVTRMVDHLAARVAAADAVLEPHRYRPPMALPEVAGFPDRASALRWLRRQWPTAARVVELAGGAGLLDRCWQLGLLLRGYFFLEKLTEPWLRTGRVALSAAMTAGRSSAVGMVHNSLGMAHLEQGELAEAAACHLAAAEVFDSIGDVLGGTDARSSLAWVHLYQGRYEPALAGLHTVLDYYRRLGRSRNQAIALRGMAYAAVGLGRDGDAMRHLDAAAPLAQTPVDLAMTHNCAGWIHHRAGRYGSAAEAYSLAAEVAGTESPYELARGLTGLGNAAAAQGDRATAYRRWREADDQPVVLDGRMCGEAAARRALARPAGESAPGGRPAAR